ncbi:hypothetical protein [Treponema sp.]|uniref:hypothetical protein n=1 Tax=Treponema sp. TaxID=166 RepID=UPI00388D8365
MRKLQAILIVTLACMVMIMVSARKQHDDKILMEQIIQEQIAAQVTPEPINMVEYYRHVKVEHPGVHPRKLEGSVKKVYDSAFDCIYHWEYDYHAPEGVSK